MAGLLTDFPHNFLVVPGIEDDAQFLLALALASVLSLMVCCCQSLVIVVRSQNWTWRSGAAWSSHLEWEVKSYKGRLENLTESLTFLWIEI